MADHQIANTKIMRKIKLQMTASVDGFVKSKQGDSVWDKGVTDFCIDNLKDVDDILLGRSTTEGFIPYWAEVAANPADEFNTLGKRLTEIPKIAFSNTIKSSKWENARVVGGNLKSEIMKIKSQPGKNIMVYGGVSFVSSLIEFDLVDEFYFLIYPFAAGNGEQIFGKLKENLFLTLKACQQFKCGIVLLRYGRRE